MAADALGVELFEVLGLLFIVKSLLVQLGAADNSK